MRLKRKLHRFYKEKILGRPYRGAPSKKREVVLQTLYRILTRPPIVKDITGHYILGATAFRYADETFKGYLPPMFTAVMAYGFGQSICHASEFECGYSQGMVHYLCQLNSMECREEFQERYRQMLSDTGKSFGEV